MKAKHTEAFLLWFE